MERTLQLVSRALFNGTRSHERRKKNASESSFSIGKKNINPYRSHLLLENVEAMLCTKSWLYGFEGILIY